MKNFDWKKLLPYVVALVVFVGLALVYCSPILGGKVLSAGDVNNWKGVANEAIEYKQTTGETTWWTNSLFGGMPTYQLTGTTPANHARKVLEDTSHLGLTNDMAAAGFLVAYFIGFFLMLLCFEVNPWLSIVGALALGLSSYFLIIIPAGHLTKASAIACLGPIIGGFYAVFRKKYWLGAPLIVLYGIIGITLHPQMSYYMCMLIGVLACAELYIHISEKRWKDLGIALGVLLLAVLLVYGTKLSWMQMNNEYLAETMRGGHSELTQSEDADKPAAGLDIDYATAWSYGKAETLTLLIPNYMGGCSGYDLGDGSELEKSMKKMGVPGKSAKQFCSGAPTYWGEKAFTSGAVYVGAIICFLFVLGLIIVPGPYKWALLVATIFSILLAWGRNFMAFTELFYNYFPMYNKFRAVESILVVAEITIPLLAFLAVKQLANAGKDDKKDKLYKNAVLIAGGVTAVVCLFVALFGGGFDVTSSYDAQWKGQVGDQIYDAILSQRHAMMKADAWRSLIFVLLGAGLTYWYATVAKIDKGLGASKQKTAIFAALLGLLILCDLVPVNRRFFGEKNFINQKDDNRFFAKQPWEEQILADEALDFRVLNVAANTFNDARTSYRLKSVGGYHAAKLRRYQDLIDAHISKNNWNVLNMLNTKYIVARDGQAHLNPDAMGNVWFVDTLTLVDTPDEESAALWNTNLHTTAIADKRFAEALDITKPEANPLMAFDENTISLTSYAPNKLVYQAQTETNKVAVFSEIYYPHDWHLYVDGKETEIARVNYVLRAAVIPAGQHEIVMEFVPAALTTDRWCLALLIIALVASFIALLFPLWKQLLPSFKK